MRSMTAFDVLVPSASCWKRGPSANAALDQVAGHHYLPSAAGHITTLRARRRVDIGENRRDRPAGVADPLLAEPEPRGGRRPTWPGSRPRSLRKFDQTWLSRWVLTETYRSRRGSPALRRPSTTSIEELVELLPLSGGLDLGSSAGGGPGAAGRRRRRDLVGARSYTFAVVR